MSQIEINRNKLDAAVSIAVQSVASVGRMHPLEAIIAFAEAAGRTIAAQNGTFVVHKELLRVATEHMESTVKAAYSSGGKDPNALN